MAIVEARDSEGNHAIGVEVEGVFVPFATVPEHRVRHAVERGKTLQERVAGDPGDRRDQAQKALDAGFVVVGSGGSSGGGGLSDKSGDELVTLAEEKGVEGVTSKTTKAELVSAIEAKDSEEGAV